MVQTIDLEGVQRPDTALFDLFATLEGPGGQVRLAVPPEVLLCYAEFQRVGLCPGGLIYRYAGSEGRPPLAADEGWRALTSQIVRSLPAPTQPSPN